MTTVGQLRNKIYLIQFVGQVPDGYGGLTTGNTAIKRTFWGDIKEVKSQREQESGQQIFSKQYKIIARHSKNYEVENGNYIIYNGKVIVVTGCINTDNDTFIEIAGIERQVGGDLVASLPQLANYGIYTYVANGGESEFISDEIKFMDAILITEEGTVNQVSETETGRLKAQFITALGKVIFDHQLQKGEIVIVFYQLPNAIPPELETLTYIATGGESEFTDAELIGKKVYFVIEEGDALWVRESVPDRLTAQFISSEGKVKFDHTLQAENIIQALYQ